jgi:hypothetical protein
MDQVSFSNQSVGQLPAGFDVNKLLPEKRQGTTSRASTQTEDQVDVNLSDVYKSLTVLGDEVLNKLDEILGDKVPGGVRSLKPEEHTPEKTADRITSGVLALFPTFARQNPELTGEELLSKFMETIRGGISQGLNDAVNILDSIGAFGFDGVKDGIDQTMHLVQEKLQAFESQYRKDNGLDSAAPTESAPVPQEEQRLAA